MDTMDTNGASSSEGSADPNALGEQRAEDIAKEMKSALTNTGSTDDDQKQPSSAKKGAHGKRRRGRRGGAAGRKRRASGADGTQELTWEEQREREERESVGTVVRRLSAMVQPPRGKRGRNNGRRFNPDTSRPSAPLVTTQDLIEKKVSEETHWSTMDSPAVQTYDEDNVPYGFDEHYNTEPLIPKDFTRDELVHLDKEQLISMLLIQKSAVKDLTERNSRLAEEVGRMTGHDDESAARQDV